ncbi:MAG: Cna B-type domain-containing protein [Lactobacillus sp.]|nr:Cna B-type domain-containing protein [Lactobacillus sp.]
MKFRKNKVKVLFMVALLLIAPILSVLTTAPNQVGATDVTHSVTGVGAGDAKITTASGQDVTHEPQLDLYTNYTLTYNWAIPDNVTINAGDTVLITLPATVATASDTKINLTDSTGKVIGTVALAHGQQQGILTFNQNFKAYNRHGAIVLNVSGKHTDSGHSNPWFVAKNGWLADSDPNTITDPTEIIWDIAVNPDNEAVNNVVLTDTLGPGQTYKAGSLSATTDNGDPKTTIPATVKVNGNQLTIDLGNITTKAMILYRTTITNLNPNTGNTWTNEVASSSTGGGAGTGVATTAKSQVVWGGHGSAQGYNGSAQLTKVDADTNTPLAGAVFALKQGDKVIQTNLTTDAQGLLKVTNLNVGDYSFVETKAPTGYLLATTPINFTITKTNNTYSNIKVTAKDAPAVTINGTKTWDDANDQAKQRPASIKVNLLANGKVVQTKTVNAASQWQYSFTNLPKTDQGKAIVYTISEDPVANYTTKINGYNITNTHVSQPATTTVSGQKTWADTNNQAGQRPDSIKVNLLANGKVVQTKTVTAADQWQYHFTNLPKFDQGKAIVYTVSEDPVTNYATKIDGYNITNTFVTTPPTKPTTTTVAGQKTWIDGADQFQQRPASIQVNLLANGKVVQTKTVTAHNNWQYEFTNLPRADQAGQTIAYTVSENYVPGYQTDINGYDITNTYILVPPTKPITATVSGNKIWQDNGNAANQRPDAITIHLLANGRVIQSKQVTAADNWHYEFSNLPLKQGNQTIVYTISEDKVPHYTSQVDGSDVINTYVPTPPVQPSQPDVPQQPDVPTTPTDPNQPLLPITPSDPQPGTPSTPTTTTTTGTVSTEAKHHLIPVSTATITGSSKQRLPQTGEDHSWSKGLSILGFVLLFSAVGIVSYKKLKVK